MLYNRSEAWTNRLLYFIPFIQYIQHSEVQSIACRLQPAKVAPAVHTALLTESESDRQGRQANTARFVVPS